MNHHAGIPYLVVIALLIIGLLAVLYGWRRVKIKQKRGSKRSSAAIHKPESIMRVMSCPACAQQIRFCLPVKKIRGQCRQCGAEFNLDVDQYANVYITEIKVPEDPVAVKSLDECFAVLEIAQDALPIDIRSAYKKRIMEYHPDKVESLGVKLKQVAEDETRRINAAYAMLEDNERV